jgi:phosphinothricin acetyltransferase
MLTIRHSTIGDLGAITEIYNQAILTTVATFDTEPKNLEEQEQWFKEHGPTSPILVAELENDVVGWVSLSTWSDRCAYSDTAEVSLYVEEECRGKGIGKKLLEAIVEAGKDAGLHTLIARVAEGNELSVALHIAVGFEQIGVMKEVGRKFGKLLDVYMLQLIYDS